MSSAVGSACADLRQLLRVFTRPVIGRFSRLGLRSSRAHLTACAPGALAPSPLAGSIVQEGSPMPFLDPPVPSPRRQCIRSSLRLATGCGSAGTYPLGHAPVVTGFLAGTRQTRHQRDGALPVPMPRTPRRPTPRHPEFRTSPRSPSCRGECSIRQVQEVSDNFPGDFSPGFGITGKISGLRPRWCRTATQFPTLSSRPSFDRLRMRAQRRAGTHFSAGTIG